MCLGNKKREGSTFSYRLAARYFCHLWLSSPLWCLTSVFGMGTGVSIMPSPPGLHQNHSKLNNAFSFLSCFFILHLFSRSSPRPISISPLRTSLYFHSWPIYLIVFKGSYSCDGKSHLEGDFTLRCLQRLFLPYLATQRCHWRDNWFTIGTSIPVLSY